MTQNQLQKYFLFLFTRSDRGSKETECRSQTFKNIGLHGGKLKQSNRFLMIPQAGEEKI
ncbi:hypothetical protein [Oligella urethralis]|uniref:hypothetical protein n=1 Tax=Oligella urethralis TaxID=90245 RepID=UPI0015F0A8A1|nr:hypothetical protein [Oligella urethralis]